ncbi:fungal-specific transcription factor domain-containing protein [Mycena vitilis]|nr:fungal-specific transcription factor domain-containing protein [Mycena vitilis]
MASEEDCKARVTYAKRRKARNSSEMPGNRCTNCITSRSECTHTPREAEPSSPPGQSFKTPHEHIESILSTTTVYVPSRDPEVSHQILVEVAQYARGLEENLAALRLQSTAASPAFSSDGTDALPVLNKTSRFYGQSSSAQFTKSAMKHIDGDTSYVVGVQRPEFWITQPWEKLTIEPPPTFFPDHDLLESLVKIYFEQINPILGILHSPSFHQAILDGVHLRDPQFGAVVLLVCALASRHSEDPRIFLDSSNSEHTCGWKWFMQVRPLRSSFSPEQPSLYQLQLLCLSAIFLTGTSTPEESWILAGLGIRFAQGVGAHLRSGYSTMQPLTAELYKRVFWLLVVCDTVMSAFKGRPSMTQPTDFDLDFPVGVDEEYWGVPNAVQPHGKASTSAFMAVHLQLMLIFARIQRAVYPVNGKTCPENVIVELDSALNKWVDEIPDHLRWDPNQSNQIFLDQSAVLYSIYYHAQILIHRPFIPAPGKESTSNTSFPSLAICANAARSCGHVLDVQARRGRGPLHYPSVMTALFDCAVVILINVWAVVGGRKSRTQEDFGRANADAQNCVRVLRLYERRWRVAGRKCDIITAMLNLGKYTSGAYSLKRSLAPEEDAAAALNNINTYTAPLDSSRPIAEQIEALERSIQETDHLFSLPLHTEELGRLPVYDSFDYEFPIKPNDMRYPDDPPYDFSGEADFQQLLQDSLFSTPSVSTADLELLPTSFDIPSGYGWQDWSAYFANVDGLDPRTY